MKHIYQCEVLSNAEEPEIEIFFEGNISEQIKVFRKFERNFENRKNLKENRRQSNCQVIQM